MPPNSLNICFRRRGSGQKSMTVPGMPRNKITAISGSQISQFANDTTLICRDIKALKENMNVENNFSAISDLELNTTKTKAQK